MDERNQIIGAVCTARDLSELRKAELLPSGPLCSDKYTGDILSPRVSKISAEIGSKREPGTAA